MVTNEMKKNQNKLIAIVSTAVIILSIAAIFLSGLIPLELVGTGPKLNIETLPSGVSTWSDSNTMYVSSSGGVYRIRVTIGSITKFCGYEIKIHWSNTNLVYNSIASGIFGIAPQVEQIDSTTILLSYQTGSSFTGSGTIFTMQFTTLSPFVAGDATFKMDLNDGVTYLMCHDNDGYIIEQQFSYDTLEVIINDSAAPIITEIQRDIQNPLPTDAVKITARILDSTTGVNKDTVKLYYKRNTQVGYYGPCLMTRLDTNYKDSYYEYMMPTYNSGVTMIISFYIVADDYATPVNHAKSTPDVVYTMTPESITTDRIPPSITNILQNPQTGPYTDESVEITAIITDTADSGVTPSGVKNATIYASFVGSGLTSQIIPMIPSGNIYTGIIPASETIGNGNAMMVQYSITACDNAENPETITGMSYAITVRPIPTSYVTIIVSQGGIVDKSSGEYTLDSSLTITATANNGYHLNYINRKNSNEIDENRTTSPTTFTNLALTESICAYFAANIPPPDTTPPTISYPITQIPSGQSINYLVNVRIAVFAADNIGGSGMKNVTIYVNQETNVGKQQDIELMSYFDGSYNYQISAQPYITVTSVTYWVIAYDNANNPSQLSDIYYYEVTHPPQDKTPPIMTNPTGPSAPVQPTEEVTITVDATDNVGIQNVCLLCLYNFTDNTFYGEQTLLNMSQVGTTSTYTYTLPSAASLSARFGKQVVAVQYLFFAFDTSGNWISLPNNGISITYLVVPEYSLIFLTLAFALSISGIAIYKVKRKKL